MSAPHSGITVESLKQVITEKLGAEYVVSIYYSPFI